MVKIGVDPELPQRTPSRSNRGRMRRSLSYLDERGAARRAGAHTRERYKRENKRLPNASKAAPSRIFGRSCGNPGMVLLNDGRRGRIEAHMRRAGMDLELHPSL